jgi:hypothetical protein
VRANGATTFAFLDDLRLEVVGSARTLRHYRAEYGRAASAPVAEPELRVAFRRTSGDGASFDGAHKTVRWHIEIAEPLDGPLRVAIDLRGEPRSFGLSLLQGYVIEPLLGLFAPAAGHVLLPAAAIGSANGAILLIGRSRSGKSSLTARAAAAGLAVLGDDHVLVAGSGECRAFPRRIRVYSDLSRTAPQAYALLPRSKQAKLRALSALRSSTRDFVAPPLRLRLETLGSSLLQPVLQLGTIVVIERDEVDSLKRELLDPRTLVEIASEILREQRRPLELLSRDDWHARLERVRKADEELLLAAFAHAVSAVRLVVPRSWPPEQAVSALATAVGADR